VLLFLADQWEGELMTVSKSTGSPLLIFWRTNDTADQWHGGPMTGPHLMVVRSWSVSTLTCLGPPNEGGGHLPFLSPPFLTPSIPKVYSLDSETAFLEVHNASPWWYLKSWPRILSPAALVMLGSLVLRLSLARLHCWSVSICLRHLIALITRCYSFWRTNEKANWWQFQNQQGPPCWLKTDFGIVAMALLGTLGTWNALPSDVHDCDLLRSFMARWKRISSTSGSSLNHFNRTFPHNIILQPRTCIRTIIWDYVRATNVFYYY